MEHKTGLYRLEKQYFMVISISGEQAEYQEVIAGRLINEVKQCHVDYLHLAESIFEFELIFKGDSIIVSAPNESINAAKKDEPWDNMTGNFEPDFEHSETTDFLSGIRAMINDDKKYTSWLEVQYTIAVSACD